MTYSSFFLCVYCRFRYGVLDCTVFAADLEELEREGYRGSIIVAHVSYSDIEKLGFQWSSA